jgi:hypothetical protein
MGRAWVLVAAAVIAPAAAMAQAPAASSSPEVPSAAPASAASAEPAKPVVPATGYGWSTPKPAAGTRVRGTRAARPRPNSPDALLPGFETLPDGSTRLFVELSKPVAFDTKKGPSSLTYILKGAHVDRRNNYNPLVTVHFNTPVTSARLVPHGKDLWFVIDLRANVTPTATMDAAKDGPSTLRIDFPKGAYVSSPPAAAPAPAPAGSAPPSTAPAPGASSPPAAAPSAPSEL